jgi:hypothetical protein
VLPITLDAFAASKSRSADLLTTITPSNPGLGSLNLDLGWIVSHDFGNDLKSAGLPGHANAAFPGKSLPARSISVFSIGPAE